MSEPARLKPALKSRPPRKRAPKSATGSRLRKALGAGGSPSRRAILWGAGGLIGVLAVSAGLLYLGYGRGRGPGHGDGAIEVDWPADLTSEQAAARLVELGLAGSQDTMAVFLRATGGTGDFVP